jgi:non-specific protein-tyrosine kinase
MNRAQARLEALAPATTLDEAAEQSQLQALVAQYSSSYATVLNSFEAVRLAEAQTSDSLVVVEAAQPETVPIRPNTRQNILLAALVASIAVLGFAVLVEHFDDSIQSSEEVEELLGISTLAAISRSKGFAVRNRLVMLKNARSSDAEVYRILGISIAFSVADCNLHTILVTSSEPLEGKSHVIANLAIALAQAGKRVILVDANLRRPALHAFFRRPNLRGLTTALMENPGRFQLSNFLLPTGVADLCLLPSGPLPPDPTRLLGSPHMANVVEALKLEADVVLFDSPSVLSAVDATLLARICDAALLIVKAGSARPDRLRRAKDHLSQSGTHILGAVLNRVTTMNGIYYQH